MDGKKMVAKIKAQVVARGMTMQEFYKLCGITGGALSQWKSGETQPTLPRLQKISDVLQISLSELLDEETKTPATEDGSGRYGLKKSDWWGIGNCFKHELNVMARPPEYLANVSGIPVDRVSAFISGEAEISKVEIEALAKAVGKPLKEIIHGYAMAFDREEDEEDAQREILNRVYDSLSVADRKTLADFAQNLALSRGLRSEGEK